MARIGTAGMDRVLLVNTRIMLIYNVYLGLYLETLFLGSPSCPRSSPDDARITKKTP
jgi:hypothetical protein